MNDVLEIDIGRLIDGAPMRRFQIVVVVLACLSIVVDGLQTQILALSVPALVRQWHVTRAAFALPTAAGLFGLVMGALAAGMLGDRFGRKTCLVASVAVFTVATALTSQVDGMWGLGVWRFVACLGLGGAVPNATSLAAEFTRADRRSLAVVLANLGIPVGGLIGGGIAAYVLSAYTWRTLFLIGAALSLLLTMALVSWMPESPRFLLRRRRGGAACRLLLKRFGVAERDHAYIVNIESGGMKASFRTLLGPGLRRDTLALAGVFFCTFLSIYTVISWLPALLGAQGLPLALTSAGLGGFNLGGIVGALIMGGLLARLGSRLPMPVLAGVAALCAFALASVPVAALGGAGGLIGILVVEGALISGVQTTLFALAAHVFPPSLRASGVGGVLAIGRLGAVASSFTGAASLAHGNATAFFGTIAAAMAASVLFLLVLNNHIPRRLPVARTAAAT